MFYALVKNSVITNIIVDEDGSFVKTLEDDYDLITKVNADGLPVVGVGYTWNGAIFEAPVVETVETPARTQITGSEIRSALTTDEKVNLEINSLDVATSDAQTRATAAKIRVFLKDLDNDLVFTVAEATARLESIGFEDQRIAEILK